MNQILILKAMLLVSSFMFKMKRSFPSRFRDSLVARSCFEADQSSDWRQQEVRSERAGWEWSNLPPWRWSSHYLLRDSQVLHLQAFLFGRFIARLPAKTCTLCHLLSLGHALQVRHHLRVVCGRRGSWWLLRSDCRSPVWPKWGSRSKLWGCRVARTEIAAFDLLLLSFSPLISQ